MFKRIVLLTFAIIIVVSALLLYLNKSKLPHIDRIILITIDTARADHFGTYGYPRNITPFIDTLAKDGVIFKRAFAPMATTSPSHASIFTSLYPYQHKLLKNGHKLNDSFITMAEILKTMDMQTAAFVSTDVHFQVGNMHQGFDFFDEPVLHDNVALNPEFKGKYRIASETMDSAIEWIDKKKTSDRFFIWIHLFDPHLPLRPPELFMKKLSEQSEAERQFFSSFFINEHKIDPSFYANTDQMLQTLNMYDSEILFIDTEIRRFYEKLLDKGLYNDSLMIITTDHGEGLGNHRWYSHGKNIYNEQILTALIFHFSSGSFSGLSIEQIVESIDILPTVIELLGGETTPLVKQFQGISLTPLLLNKFKEVPEKYAFAQRREFEKKDILENVDPEKLNYEEGEKYSLQNAEYKYIYRTQGNDEFYNVQEDPYELYNIINSDSAMKDKFKKNIIKMIEQFREDADIESETVNEETIERLKALGYVQ